jgi:ubiquinone/menaquinone biosynthesis C-methylase UbiE
MSTEILGIRLPKQKKQLFESVCLELNTTPSAVTRQLIEIYLKNAPKLIQKHRKEIRALENFVEEVQNHPEYQQNN